MLLFTGTKEPLVCEERLKVAPNSSMMLKLKGPDPVVFKMRFTGFVLHWITLPLNDILGVDVRFTWTTACAVQGPQLNVYV